MDLFVILYLVKIRQETAEELADKHFTVSKDAWLRLFSYLL